MAQVSDYEEGCNTNGFIISNFEHFLKEQNRFKENRTEITKYHAMKIGLSCIGPFFFFKADFIAHQIPAVKGEIRGNKLDDPYSHEKLFYDYFGRGEYIDIPRGCVVWDIVDERAIIYLDDCIVKMGGTVSKIAEIFGLTDYTVEYDDHYVCPKCMGDIWEE